MFVKPITADIGGFGSGAMVELLQSETTTGTAADETICMCAKATHFCSYTWSYPFRLLLDTLGAFEKEQPLGKGQQHFYFVDQFAMNQHKMTRKISLIDEETMQKELVGTLKESIQVPNRMVMILSPWHDPVPMQRAWCLFELYCALTLQAEVQMALPPVDAADFYKTLIQKRGESVDGATFDAKQHIGRIDAQVATASVQTDKEMIFKIIAKEIGFEGFNRKMQNYMEQALRDVASAAAQRNL